MSVIKKILASGIILTAYIVIMFALAVCTKEAFQLTLPIWALTSITSGGFILIITLIVWAEEVLNGRFN